VSATAGQRHQTRMWCPRSCMFLLLLAMPLRVTAEDTLPPASAPKAVVTTPAHVIVTLSFSQTYLKAAVGLVGLVRRNGNYSGDVVVLCGRGCADTEHATASALTARELEHVQFVSVFSLIKFPPPERACKGGPHASSKRTKNWPGYYAKTAMFSPFFKAWRRVLYMDSRVNVRLPLLGLFFSAIDSSKSVLANPDSFPKMEWTLRSQFHSDCDPLLFNKLEQLVDLNTTDYFQSTVVLYDTDALPGPSAYEELVEMYHTWGPIADSDQSILSLYFAATKRLYRPFPYRIENGILPYDFAERIPDGKYILNAWRTFLV